MSVAFLVGDWGGTHLRGWSLDASGAVLQRREFELGVNSLAPGEAAVRFRDEVRPALGAEGAPALLCGAIGSNVGWATAPYVDCPASVEAVAIGLMRIDGMGPPVWIAPGIRCQGITAAPDVLRGEETQAFGWLALDPERARGRRIICHPGTHSKWLRLEDGRIERFVSAFTGEVWELLNRDSILKSPPPWADDAAAFAEGLAAAGDGEALMARLYAARGRIAGAGAPPETTPAFLSGLLIGHEAASLPTLIGAAPDEAIDVIGSPELCVRYAHALARRGWTVHTHDGETAALAGLTALVRFLSGRGAAI